LIKLCQNIAEIRFISRVSILTRDIDIANLPVCLLCSGIV